MHVFVRLRVTKVQDTSKFVQKKFKAILPVHVNKVHMACITIVIVTQLVPAWLYGKLLNILSTFF